jgi:hypothetical protein
VASTTKEKKIIMIILIISIIIIIVHIWVGNKSGPLRAGLGLGIKIFRAPQQGRTD